MSWNLPCKPEILNQTYAEISAVYIMRNQRTCQNSPNQGQGDLALSSCKNLLFVTPTSSHLGNCSSRPASGKGSKLAPSKTDRSTSGKGLGGRPNDTVYIYIRTVSS